MVLQGFAEHHPSTSPFIISLVYFHTWITGVCVVVVVGVCVCGSFLTHREVVWKEKPQHWHFSGTEQSGRHPIT